MRTSCALSNTMAEDSSGCAGQPEKILVSIRVRPLNEKEIARNDVSDWECVNNDTILCRNNLPERSLFPSACTFDRVFGCDTPTKQVYEEGAKEVALSVVHGINASIFAYGQTSSGKTYTMTGITQEAINDFFEYIEKHKEREFSLKFSAMEIYNEAVRDLLSSDNTPLRLLDDPERGTIVEKLTEETLRGRRHLAELLSICETQRMIGETSLNETSSRSHQILRLTIESSAKEYMGADTSSILTASICFVDLAGSERASQTNSGGTRLKEGCHINRSLLTLGTVIRKLSKGKSGHVPYRDSKLTRILQNSLGGNARTAIICTMSPARSHVEQSRNTLLFASCAKDVSTSAQVNLVVSEKALVKQLQKELARMERELRSLGSSSINSEFPVLLREKEELIEQMDKQIKELTWQRDLAQSRVKDLLRSEGDNQASKDEKCYVVISSDSHKHPVLDMDQHRIRDRSKDSDEPGLTDSGRNLLELPESCDDEFLLDDSTPQFNGLDAGRGWEDITHVADEESQDAWKEVRCIEVENPVDSGNFGMGQIIDRKTVTEVLPTVLDEMEKQNEKVQLVPFLVYEAKDEVLPVTDDKHDDKKELLEEKKQRLSPCLKDTNDEKTLDTGEKQPLTPVKGDQLKSYPEDSSTDLVSSAQKEGKKDSLEKDDVEKHTDTDDAYEALKEKVRKLQKTIDYLMRSHALEYSPSLEADYLSPISLKFRSRSCRENLLLKSSLWLETPEQKGNLSFRSDFVIRPRGHYAHRLSEQLDLTSSTWKLLSSNVSISSFDTESTVSSTSMEAQSIRDVGITNSFHDYIARLNQMAANAQISEGSPLHDQINGMNKSAAQEKGIRQENTLGGERSDAEDTQASPGFLTLERKMEDMSEAKLGDESIPHSENEDTQFRENIESSGSETLSASSNWPSQFERQQKEIIKLWSACSVPLVHRTYFFSLFRGDRSDFVYMEVELRRLAFLKDSQSREANTTRRESAKMLSREREWLSKQIPKKYSRKEREELYEKWGIKLNSRKRSLQLTNLLWNNTNDMQHIRESAELVAKLVGLTEPSKLSKEMFGLSLSPRSVNMKSFTRKYTISPLL